MVCSVVWDISRHRRRGDEQSIARFGYCPRRRLSLLLSASMAIRDAPYGPTGREDVSFVCPAREGVKWFPGGVECAQPIIVLVKEMNATVLLLSREGPLMPWLCSRIMHAPVRATKKAYKVFEDKSFICMRISSRNTSREHPKFNSFTQVDWD
jgi:hypothetical protein